MSVAECLFALMIHQDSPEAVEKELETLNAELRGAMFLVGAANVDELMNAQVMVTGETADWLNAMELEE